MISKLPFPTTVPGNPKKPILNGVKKTPNELIKKAWMNLSPKQYVVLFNCFKFIAEKVILHCFKSHSSVDDLHGNR